MGGLSRAIDENDTSLIFHRSRNPPMQPFRSILFAGDFSENSVQAFHVACMLSHEDQTHLTVLHVAPPDRVAEHRTIPGQPVAGSPRTPAVEDPRQGLKHELRDVYSADRPLDVHYRTSIGDDPSTEILHVADEIGAELIVMGTHGRTGLRRLMAGSVASSVLAGSHCSVLALHGGAARLQGRCDPGHPPPHGLLGSLRDRTQGRPLPGPGPWGTSHRPPHRPARRECGREHVAGLGIE